MTGTGYAHQAGGKEDSADLRCADVGIGIGSSYLGARAAIEFVNGQFYNQVRRRAFRCTLPATTFRRLFGNIIKMIGDRDFCINIISKSGTTTPPAITFRELKKLCSKIRQGRGATHLRHDG